MRLNAFSVIFILMSSFITFPAAAQTKAPDFSATLVVVEKETTIEGKIYFTKGKQRLEMRSPESGDKSIIITRLDKDVAWMIMPSEKVYMEMPIEQKKPNPLAEDPDRIIKREKIGRDRVDGHPCLKERVTVKYDDGRKEPMYWWQATDLGWPIQAEAIDGSWRYTYMDIVAGKQDPALFEVPKGYRRMEAPDFNAPDPPDYPEAPELPEPPSYSEPAPYYLEPPEPPTPSLPPIPSPPVPW